MKDKLKEFDKLFMNGFKMHISKHYSEVALEIKFANEIKNWIAKNFVPVDLQVKTIDNYDIWYEPCEKCGYDTGNSVLPDLRDGNKRCCRCGNPIKRDYSDRALKSENRK